MLAGNPLDTTCRIPLGQQIIDRSARADRWSNGVQIGLQSFVVTFGLELLGHFAERHVIGAEGFDNVQQNETAAELGRQVGGNRQRSNWNSRKSRWDAKWFWARTCVDFP